MGDNRGTLAKRLESEVKLSRGPFKSRVGSLDPVARKLSGPDCTCLSLFLLILREEYPLS